MKFAVNQATHAGGRARNEDRLGCTYTRQAVLLVLADGLGGHPDGDRAADIAVRTFVQDFIDQAQPKLRDPSAFLQATVMHAHHAIRQAAHSDGLDEPPRTTVVAAVVQEGCLTALHSGDSRLYWARGGRLLLRTRDHSYHDKPELFPPQPAGVSRSVLFTCLGANTPPLYDVVDPQPLAAADRILLCSDGLWGVMSDDDIAAGLYGQPLADAVAQLSEEALRRGGRHGDNVSLLGLEWQEDDDFPATQVLEPEAATRARPQPAANPTPAPGLTATELDDEAIERTIAEINDAIRRTRRTPAPASPRPGAAPPPKRQTP